MPRSARASGFSSPSASPSCFTLPSPIPYPKTRQYRHPHRPRHLRSPHRHFSRHSRPHPPRGPRSRRHSRRHPYRPCQCFYVQPSFARSKHPHRHDVRQYRYFAFLHHRPPPSFLPSPSMTATPFSLQEESFLSAIWQNALPASSAQLSPLASALRLPLWYSAHLLPRHRPPRSHHATNANFLHSDARPNFTRNSLANHNINRYVHAMAKPYASRNQ